MAKQSDMFKQTEDALLAERLMQTVIGPRVQGHYRTPDQYVNSPMIAEMLMGEIGVRNVVEFCVTELERRDGN